MKTQSVEFSPEKGLCFLAESDPSNMIYGASLKTGIATYVGSGINVLEASGPNPDSTKASLFISDVYNQNDYIEVIRVNTANTVSYASSKLSEIFKSAEIEATVKTGPAVAFFTGGIESKYQTSNRLSNTVKFYNAIASVESEKHVLDAKYALANNMRNIVKTNVLNDIDDSKITPLELFDGYGTHIITAATIGGCLEVNGLYNASESITDAQFKATIDAACSYVSASASTTLTESQKTLVSETKINAKSFGGGIAIVAGMHSFEEISSVFKEWAKSIRDERNHVLAKVYKYMPIWELAGSNARKDEIKNAFIEIAESKYEFVKHYLVADLVALEVPSPDSSPCYIGFKQFEGVGFDYICFVANGRYKAKAKPFSGIDRSTKFDMYTYYNKRVVFRVHESPIPQYLTVHYQSDILGSTEKGNLNQMFVLTPENRVVTDRQKFTFEEYRVDNKLKGYKIKWRSSDEEDWKYMTSRKFEREIQVFAQRKVKEIETLYFMDGNAESACVFKILKL